MLSTASGIPDGPLCALRVGTYPPALRAPLLREAARACATYVCGGGRLSDIDETASRFQAGHLMLLPLPPQPVPLPDRTLLTADLLRFRDRWDLLRLTPAETGRFLLRFCRGLDRKDPKNRSARCFARQWLLQAERDLAARQPEKLRTLLQQVPPPASGSGYTGCWLGRPLEEHPALLAELQALCSRKAGTLHQARRATVHRGILLGEAVIVKAFTPNPRVWRRHLGPSRARHAWAATHLLQQCRLPCPEPLGLIEHYQHGVVTESYVLHRPIPQTLPLHRWLRRYGPTLSPRDREHLRHRLREQLLRLYRTGILHRDCKLHNLLVTNTPHVPTAFWWIDLEDIRAPRRVRLLSLIRNFYQLNGSLPRNFPPAEREAFARGFQYRFPGCHHPLVLQFVAWKTRRRLRRQRHLMKRS